MEAGIALSVQGSKFMWDGEVYDTKDAAEAKISVYRDAGFDTHLVTEEGRCLVYNRRVAKEVVLAPQN